MPFPSLQTIISNLGLTSGQQICLDAGDSACYSGSGQQLNDLSGVGNNFARGASTGTGSDDPTFAGVAGNLSINEKFTLDGGGIFGLIGAANPAAIETMHKAGAKWTILLAINFVHSSSITQQLIGTRGGTGTSRGFVINIQSSTDTLRVLVGNGGASILSVDTATLTPGLNIIAVSLDDAAGAGGSSWMANGVTGTWNGALASPASANANSKLELCGSGGTGATGAPIAGSAFFAMGLWTGVAMTGAQMSQLYSQLGQRLGLVVPPQLIGALGSRSLPIMGRGTIQVIGGDRSLVQATEALNPSGDGEVFLYEVWLAPSGSGTLYLKNNDEVTWQGQLYEKAAIQVTGVSVSTEKGDSSPKLQFANPADIFTPFILSGALEKATLIRKRVLRKHLDANARIYTQRTWYISQVTKIVDSQVYCDLKNLSDGPVYLAPARTYRPPEFPVVSLG